MKMEWALKMPIGRFIWWLPRESWESAKDANLQLLTMSVTVITVLYVGNDSAKVL